MEDKEKEAVASVAAAPAAVAPAPSADVATPEQVAAIDAALAKLNQVSHTNCSGA